MTGKTEFLEFIKTLDTNTKRSVMEVCRKSMSPADRKLDILESLEWLDPDLDCAIEKINQMQYEEPIEHILPDLGFDEVVRQNPGIEERETFCTDCLYHGEGCRCVK